MDQLGLLMLLGLIVPPLYFVIPIGLMDRDYLGLRYANKPSKNSQQHKNH